jgi:hypothetical protein
MIEENRAGSGLSLDPAFSCPENLAARASLPLGLQVQ